MRPCKKEDCSVSTFIDEETLTFGSGMLDYYGLWENPCEICAEAYLKAHPEASVFPWPQNNNQKTNEEKNHG